MGLHRRARSRRTTLVPLLALLLWSIGGLTAAGVASAQTDDGFGDGADDGSVADDDGSDDGGLLGLDGGDGEADDEEGQLDDLGAEDTDAGQDDGGVLDEADTLDDDAFDDGGAEDLGDDTLEDDPLDGDTLGGGLDDPPAPVGGVDAGFGGAAGDGTLPWTAAAAALLALTFGLWASAQRRTAA